LIAAAANDFAARLSPIGNGQFSEWRCTPFRCVTLDFLGEGV
jgi:hypothetical protein